MRTSRIYPVELKPASHIRSWDDWPEDVVERLKHWNKGHRGLSFTGHGVFKCSDCERFCEPQPYGTATLKHYGAVKSGVPICDDCLIERARRANSKAESIELGRPNGVGSCVCPTPKRDADTGCYDWRIRPDCTYHAMAARHPRNHSIPWNCPTFWDGCNCLLPQHNGPDASR